MEVIEKLPPPISVKGMRNFLGHVDFTRRFIKISQKLYSLCKLLEKECKFYFDESCLKEFRELKEKLVFRASIISPDWCDPFELMCDAIGVALGVVLGHIRDKILHPF